MEADTGVKQREEGLDGKDEEGERDDYPHALVNFLRRDGLGSLQQRYAITAAHHKRYPNLVCLKYNQIRSPMTSRIVQQCRGVVVDVDDDWKVVAYPYIKFFNLGEPGQARLDWSTARVYEKLDGSIMTLYHYRGQWHVATSGRPDASGTVNGITCSYHDLFWEIWKALGYSEPKDLHICYMFELVSERNRIITKVDRDRIVLHGARDMRTYRELDPVPLAKRNQWECVRTFPMSELEQVVTAARQLNPALAEGFVVCDAQFRRVKIKSPQYVAIAGLTTHDKNMTNKRRMLQIVMANEGAEYLSYFPEWAGLHRHISGKYSELCLRIQETHQQLIAKEQGKAYQDAVENHIFRKYLLALREGKDLREYLASRLVKEVEEIMLQERMLDPSTKYLPSSNSEKGFVSSAVVSATISVEEQDSPPKGRRAKGRKAKLHQEDEEDQSLQAIAFSRKDKQKKNKKPSAQGKNAKKKERRRR